MTQTLPPPSTTMRAPDPILAELWEVKRQINAEANYDIATLARMAHEAARKLEKVPVGQDGQDKPA
ncbi:MAG: hypothetical protein PHU46_15430 [Rhodocyclaceae bacterium]|nr:hypothetical protein [Rhodocyclaceae bacterium]